MGIINSWLPTTWWTRKRAHVLQHVHVLSFTLCHLHGYSHFSTTEGRIFDSLLMIPGTIYSHGIWHRKQSHSFIGIKTWLWSCCFGRGCKTKAFSEGKYIGMMHDSASFIVSSTDWNHIARLQTLFASFNGFDMSTFSAGQLVYEHLCWRYAIGLEKESCNDMEAIWLTQDDWPYVLFTTGDPFIIGTCSILCRCYYDSLSNVNMSSIRRAVIDVKYQCYNGVYCSNFLQYRWASGNNQGYTKEA